MKITISVTKQELKDAMKSNDSFEQFIDICKCRYGLELFRAIFECINKVVKHG